MTDRAKKISELSVTTSVANTDKLIVLKDAANASIANTRSITVNNFANVLKPLVQNIIPNTTVIANSVVFASNGTNNVAFITYTIGEGKTGCSDLILHCADANSESVTAAHVLTVANTSTVSSSVTSVEVGDNPILFTPSPTISSNVVTLYFTRGSAATTNVRIRYCLTIY